MKNDDRYYAAMDAADIERDQLFNDIRRVWRKARKVCDDCDVEDGLHAPDCPWFEAALDVPYPAHCTQPAKCAGHSCCQRDPNCIE